MAKKNEKSRKKVLLISLQKAAYILNVSLPTIEEWIAERKIKIRNNENNIACIDYETDFGKLTYDDSRIERSHKDIKIYLEDCSKSDIDAIKVSINRNIEEYKGYISLLEEYHRSLTVNYDLLCDKTEVVAALLIYLKIINISHMFILSISEGINSSLILVRTIDEAVTLAQYFILLKDDSTCQNDLKRWYHLEKSPSPSECRKKVMSALTSGTPFTYEQVFPLSDDIYQIKSKSVHHSFRDCNKLLELEIKEESIHIKEFCYKSSNVFRKDEIIEYFSSIINSVMQGFIICFKDILEKEKLDNLVNITTGISFKDS